MFINIDYNKRQQEAKLHLAKPNKRTVSIISEKFNDEVNMKLGNINELNFSIPHYIDGETNKHIDLIKEKMLIKLTLGSYKEWFIVEEIDEDSSNSDVFNVKAFSLGYELKGKRVKEVKEDSINARELLERLLAPTSWRVGNVSALFEVMYRNFESSDSNVLDCILQMGETYGALIKWDSISKKISLEDMRADGKFRGMSVNYGRLMQSIKRTRTTDEMVTRLYVYGSEDMDITSVNPTGQLYLENFDYFMFPFERDINRNVVKSSDFMSDELCHAILDHQDAVLEYSSRIIALQKDRAIKNTELVTESSNLTTLKMQLDNILELLDLAQANNQETLIANRKSERDAKMIEVDAKQNLVGVLLNQILALETDIESFQNLIITDSNFTPELFNELDFYIIENEWRDDRYIDLQELYDDGVKKFNELKQPKVVIDVSIDNLLNIIEEQYYWDKLVIGDLIKVKYPQMKIEYMAKIIEINYNMGAGEANVVIANTSDLLNETEKLVQLLYGSSNATSIIQNNKYKWDKINAIQNEVNQIISQEWDANKNKIIAGVNNSIEVGKRGIVISNPDFPDEVVIMQSGIIALSMDRGETWKTAIKPDGIVAERLIGKVIAGQELIITNRTGSFTMDNNGFQIDADSFVVRSGSGSGNINLRDVWNGTTDFVDALIDDGIVTAYEKKMLKVEWDKILVLNTSLSSRLNGFGEEMANNQDVRDFHTYYTELFDYLFTTIHTDGYALLSELNIAKSTRVEKSLFDSKFKNYYTARVKVEEILSSSTKYLADQAQTSADEAKNNVKELENDIVWKIEIHSSNGMTFKNNIINTTLTARIYRGMDDVTDTLPKTAFVWRKFNKLGVEDTAWTTDNIGIGNTIMLTHVDVVEKATFKCDANITIQ